MSDVGVQPRITTEVWDECANLLRGVVSERLTAAAGCWLLAAH